MILEDALVMARCLSDQREPVVALRAYEARGRKRTAAATRQSALVGNVGQWEQPLLCSLRDGLTPLVFVTVLSKLFVAHLSDGPHPDA
jgi:2-polyprenyl-6-methoxyphenol hydroxylase-like FAD-dependent oxidoreductase